MHIYCMSGNTLHTEKQNISLTLRYFKSINWFTTTTNWTNRCSFYQGKQFIMTRGGLMKKAKSWPISPNIGESSCSGAKGSMWLWNFTRNYTPSHSAHELQNIIPAIKFGNLSLTFWGCSQGFGKLSIYRKYYLCRAQILYWRKHRLTTLRRSFLSYCCMATIGNISYSQDFLYLIFPTRTSSSSASGGVYCIEYFQNLEHS